MLYMLQERKEKVAHALSLILSSEHMERGLGFRKKSDFILRHILCVSKRDSGLILSRYRKILLQNTYLKSGMGCPCQVNFLKRLDIFNS